MRNVWNVRHVRVWDFAIKDFRHIHWKHYLGRKVIVLVTIGAASIFVEHRMHIWVAGKAGELFIGTLIEHLLGIPLVEEGANAHLSS